MKKFFIKMDLFIKAIMPYASVIAIIIGVMNIVYIRHAQEEINDVQIQVNNIENAVNNISADYDNSDVLDLIKNSHNIIMDKINKVNSDLEWEISCVKRRL